MGETCQASAALGEKVLVASFGWLTFKGGAAEKLMPS